MVSLMCSTGCRRTVVAASGRWWCCCCCCCCCWWWWWWWCCCCCCWWWWCWWWCGLQLARFVQVQVQPMLQACWPAKRCPTRPGVIAAAAALLMLFSRGGGRDTAPPGTNGYEWKYVVMEDRASSAPIVSANQHLPFPNWGTNKPRPPNECSLQNNLPPPPPPPPRCSSPGQPRSNDAWWWRASVLLAAVRLDSHDGHHTLATWLRSFFPSSFNGFVSAARKNRTARPIIYHPFRFAYTPLSIYSSSVYDCFFPLFFFFFFFFFPRYARA